MILTGGPDDLDGSIVSAGGLLCSAVYEIGSPPVISLIFTDCITAPAHQFVSFDGTLSGDTMTGQLTGWEFSDTPITLTRLRR